MSTHLAELTEAYSGGSPTPETTGPRGTVAPLPATLTTATATSGFVPHDTAPAPGMVDNDAVMQSSVDAIHGAEKAVDTMDIYEGALGNIELVMKVMDSVVGVCISLLVLSIDANTLSI